MKKPKSRDEAIEMLSEYLSLSDEAIQMAEGWMLLEPRVQRHVKIIIDENIASRSEILRQAYANVSHADQQRFNSIIEKAQADSRDKGTDV